VFYPRRVADLATILAETQSSDWRVRVAAVTRLREFDDPAAREAITKALYDPEDTAVTEAAVDVMVKRGDASDVEALLAALQSDDFETAQHVYGFLAARALRYEVAQTVLDREDDVPQGS
jgi:HEAT repeat protein